MKTTDPVQFAKALSDETRQKIMELICCKWISVNEIVEQTNVSQPTVSHHLGILRESNLVDGREMGKQTFYKLNQKRVSFCCDQIIAKFSTEKAINDE
ncbi:MAG: metalloregulator ArsR/SmtB family transcription factor [Pelolinea sp.]|nr:metalloregulator ArsR/SmtB family transcription factor [Pelolinea sp.]